jgi:hypothetical protein
MLAWWLARDGSLLPFKPIAPLKSAEQAVAAVPASTADPSTISILPKSQPDTSRSVKGPWTRMNLSGPGSVSAHNVLKSPAEHIELARGGNAASAIGLFAALNSCFPMSNENNEIERPPIPSVGQRPISNWPECSVLPPEIAVNRLNVLKAAIEKGSAEAKLIYASSIKQVYYSDQFSASPELNSFDQVQRLSEKYANEAAQTGLREAITFLALSYMNGAYGARDITKSYGLFLALREVEAAPEYDNFMAILKAQLSPSQAAEAETVRQDFLANCCVKEN